MLSLRASQDLLSAAELTLRNMQPYYDKYQVDWDIVQIVELTQSLTNYDLFDKDNRVGIMRLSFENHCCQLRDLQIEAQQQGRGFGSAAIAEAKGIAEQQGLFKIELKVFQCSPAYKLYVRFGFRMVREDQRFCYMNLQF
jgi:GNAT superfamily N-acetyltransferase